jgi:hypothetical protein
VDKKKRERKRRRERKENFTSSVLSEKHLSKPKMALLRLIFLTKREHIPAIPLLEDILSSLALVLMLHILYQIANK